MDLSQIKMVVSDMDGTLLNSNHKVSTRFFELFHELKKRDILFVAASGRQYHSILDKLTRIKDDIIIIAENGAVVKKQEQDLLITPLGQDLQNELLGVINDIEGAHAMLCGKYTSYFDGQSASFLDQLKEYYSNYEIHDTYEHITDEIVKIAVYHPESAENFIYPVLKKYEDVLKVKVSGQHWVDLNHIKANKGYALEHVLKHFNLAPENVLVFGDYNNDLEMLALTKNSVAMKNAHPNVIALANHLTTSNDDFGVERVLEKLLKAL